ncbi:MAG: hypothetical protein AAGG51_19015 [Cyanobacteria bacterium P01_G01_bin.54]
MSKQLALEISDEVYADLQRKANALGLSMTEWIVIILSQQNLATNRTQLSPEQQEQARQNFKRHAGAIDLGYVTGSGNDQIDADLARAYADENLIISL